MNQRIKAIIVAFLVFWLFHFLSIFISGVDIGFDTIFGFVGYEDPFAGFAIYIWFGGVVLSFITYIMLTRKKGSSK